MNPSDSEGSRFLLTSIALEPTDADLKDELVARDVELRDALLKVLGGKTVDQLVDIGQRAALAEDLKAAIEGRQQLTEDDLPLVAKVTLSSMPTKRRKVFLALVQNKGATLSVAQVQAALGARHPDTARTVMADLDRLGIMEYVEENTGKPAHLRFRSAWSWCARPSFRKLFRRRVR